MSGKGTTGIIVKLSHMRLLMPCLLVTIMVLDGLLGYTMPETFNGVETVTQQAYAAEVPELEELAQTAERQVSKGPAGKLPSVAEDGEYNDGEYTGSASGFGGTITVKVTIKDGKIVSIKVLSAAGETSSYFSRACKVISRIINKQSTNVDAVSGATYSSNGIIKAVRNALAKATKKKTKKEKTDKVKSPKKQPRKAVKPDTISSGKWRDGEYIGEGEGFGGKLHVKVTIAEGKIVSIELLDTLDGEEFISKAQKGIFPDVVKKQGTDVDSVTGATFSSYGLIEAINDALKKAADDSADDNPADDEDGSGQTGTGGAGGTGTDSGGTSDKAYKDGTYTVTAMCTRDGWFDYDINISLTVSDGRISSISMYKGDDFTENEYDQLENDEYLDMAVNGYGSRKGMIGLILDAQSADVDTVTGATYSSNAIRSSVKELLSGIKMDESSEEDEDADSAADSQSDKAIKKAKKPADISPDSIAASDADASDPGDNVGDIGDNAGDAADNADESAASQADAGSVSSEAAADPPDPIEEDADGSSQADGHEDDADASTDSGDVFAQSE